jgi:hypothetical protein
MYAQVKANIDKLDKKGKQRILQLLQKSIQTAPAKAPAAAGAAPTPGADAAPDQGEQGAQAATTPATTPAKPAAEVPAADPAAAPAPGTADPAAPVKQRTGGRVKGQLSQNPRAVKRREANAAKTKQQAQAPTQAELDADRERMMGNFTDSIERHKKRMVAEALQRGEMSFFRK